MKSKTSKEKMIVSVSTFVKWAGGKKQLLNQFIEFYPSKIERYLEPFVGSGAVAFYIMKNRKPKEIIISDINEELINAYEVIQNNVGELIKVLKEYKKAHNEKTYYEIRAKDPSKMDKIQRAARFIYLNKTCFNGLYRVNSKGQFNVPIGSYKNPAICQERDLREISPLLKNVKIKKESFENVLNYAQKGDFVYFDPPYYPLKNGKSFTTYTKENFLEEEQKRLAKVFKKLHERGCYVMLSNSDTDFIKELYQGFNIHTVKAARMINCNGADRGKINEVVVTNYPIKSIQKKI